MFINHPKRPSKDKDGLGPKFLQYGGNQGNDSFCLMVGYLVAQQGIGHKNQFLLQPSTMTQYSSKSYKIIKLILIFKFGPGMGKSDNLSWRWFKVLMKGFGKQYQLYIAISLKTLQSKGLCNMFLKSNSEKIFGNQIPFLGSNWSQISHNKWFQTPQRCKQ